MFYALLFSLFWDHSVTYCASHDLIKFWTIIYSYINLSVDFCFTFKTNNCKPLFRCPCVGPPSWLWMSQCFQNDRKSWKGGWIYNNRTWSSPRTAQNLTGFFNYKVHNSKQVTVRRLVCQSRVLASLLPQVITLPPQCQYRSTDNTTLYENGTVDFSNYSNTGNTSNCSS